MTALDDAPQAAARRVATMERGRQRAQEDLAGLNETAATAVIPRPASTTLITRTRFDGARLLEDCRTVLNHFAVWPSEAALIAASVWPAHAHAKAKDKYTGANMPVWQYTPKLFFTSKHGGSGKSQMARLVGKLSPNGMHLVEPTKASMVRLIAKQSTVIITELDLLVGNGGRNKALIALANATYERDQATSRIDHGRELTIPLMCPMVLDGLDSVIKDTGQEMRTFVSRAIVIPVKRAPDGYRAPRFDTRARDVFAFGAEKLAAWMSHEVNEGIGEDIPEMPEGLGNRPASLWEPLLVVADRAGGPWPERIRQACADLETGAGDIEQADQEERYQDALAAYAADGDDAGAEEA